MKNKNHKAFETLIEIRKNNNLTIKQMADKLNISNAFYCQLENRSRRLSYDMAVRISKVFDSKPDKIFYNDFN